MSQTNRWYVFGRKVAQADAGLYKIEPGTVYVIDGWSRTKEAATARRTRLDVKGRAGIMVFSATRQQAMADVMEVYDGVVVDGYISPENKRAGQQVVKSMVMREIFCPFSGRLLDMRRAVVIDTTTRMFVMEATHWDEVREQFRSHLGEVAFAMVTVYDGRELFKR